MNLVVDTNILVSFFRETPVRIIMINPKLFSLNLYTPEYGFSELISIKKELVKYSKIPKENLAFAFEELKKCIKIIPSEVFKEQEEKAKNISPHEKDIPFFALALKLKCAIWSNEPAFKKQKTIKIFDTRDLIKILGL